MEFSYRECANPVPQNGGKYCEGQRVQYQSCNTQPCDNEGENQHEAAFRERHAKLPTDFIFITSGLSGQRQQVILHSQKTL